MFTNDSRKTHGPAWSHASFLVGVPRLLQVRRLGWLGTKTIVTEGAVGVPRDEGFGKGLGRQVERRGGTSSLRSRAKSPRR